MQQQRGSIGVLWLSAAAIGALGGWHWPTLAHVCDGPTNEGSGDYIYAFYSGSIETDTGLIQFDESDQSPLPAHILADVPSIIDEQTDPAYISFYDPYFTVTLE